MWIAFSKILLIVGRIEIGLQLEGSSFPPDLWTGIILADFPILGNVLFLIGGLNSWVRVGVITDTTSLSIRALILSKSVALLVF